RLTDYLLAFKRTYTPQQHELSAELRLSRPDDDERIELWRRPLDSEARLEAERNHTDALTRQFTAQLDYTRMLGEHTKLETGYKRTARWLDHDFLVEEDPLGTGQFTRSDRSNALELGETVDAVYGVVSQGLGKLDVQAGLRLEHASRDFTLADVGESFPYTYNSL